MVSLPHFAPPGQPRRPAAPYSSLALAPCDLCDGWQNIPDGNGGSDPCPECRPSFVEVLGPTASQPHRAARWNPAGVRCACAGTLELADRKDAKSYDVTEVIPGRGFGDGRAFRLAKADGTGHYDCFLAAERRFSTCDCAGFTYAGSAKANRRAGRVVSETLGCRHLDGVAAVVDNGWLPDPRSNPEADFGPTEFDAASLPEPTFA